MIEKNEEVIYAINANVVIVDNNTTLLKKTKDMFSLTNALNGVVVITNKRILFCSSVLGNTKIKQIRIEEIRSMDENIDRLTKMGQFRIQGITETFVINIFKTKIVDNLRSNIYKAQEMQKISNVEISSNCKLSNADEIIKFKQLLDIGFIDGASHNYSGKEKVLAEQIRKFITYI